MKKNQKIIAIVGVVVFLVFVGIIIWYKQDQKSKIQKEEPEGSEPATEEPVEYPTDLPD